MTLPAYMYGNPADILDRKREEAERKRFKAARRHKAQVKKALKKGKK
jgi:hypothetical protein